MTDSESSLISHQERKRILTLITSCKRKQLFNSVQLNTNWWIRGSSESLQRTLNKVGTKLAFQVNDGYETLRQPFIQVQLSKNRQWGWKKLSNPRMHWRGEKWDIWKQHLFSEPWYVECTYVASEICSNVTYSLSIFQIIIKTSVQATGIGNHLCCDYGQQSAPKNWIRDFTNQARDKRNVTIIIIIIIIIRIAIVSHHCCCLVTGWPCRLVSIISLTVIK